MKKAFLSYSHRDKAQVIKIARGLKMHGVSTWLDDWQIIIGDLLNPILETAIEKCDCFVLFWSSSAEQSKFVELERKYAALYPDKRRVWVRFDNTIPPPELSQYVWLDWLSGGDSRTWEDKLILLARAIHMKPIYDPPHKLRKPTKEMLSSIFLSLAEYYGVQDWWTQSDKFRLCLEAILKQGATQEKVNAAIENLETHQALTPPALYDLPFAELKELIKSCGRAKAKASFIKNFVTHLEQHYGFEVLKLFEKESFCLRTELLSIKGIGQFTCDNILLYGANRHVLPINTYSRKILYEHNLIDPTHSYQRVQERLQDALLVFSTRELRELDRMLFRVARDFDCHFEANCENCPLRPFHST